MVGLTCGRALRCPVGPGWACDGHGGCLDMVSGLEGRVGRVGCGPAVNASQRRLGQNPAPSQSQMHRRKASQQSAHSDGPHPPRQATSGLPPCARRVRPRPGFAPALGAPRQYHAAAGAGEDYRGWCAGSASRKIRGRGAWNGAPHTATSCSAAHRPPGGGGWLRWAPSAAMGASGLV